NAPTCIGTSHAEDFTRPRPAPPFSAGAERNVGIHVKRPQYAKRTHIATRLAATVRPRSGRRNAGRIETRAPLARPAIHVAGSGTLVRTHAAKSAGTRPARKSTRHPCAGRIHAASPAARR